MSSSRIPSPSSISTAAIDCSGTDNTIVSPSTSSKRLHILGIVIVLTSTAVVTLKGATTSLTGPMTLGALSLDMVFLAGSAGAGLQPLWTLGAGEAFKIAMVSGVQCSGTVWYVEEST